ncbi:MAG TPA: hypothetical protein DD640_06975 [Clostridiales bacterium]|nr:hypothetical protein [Clostridiales bacterium]
MKRKSSKRLTTLILVFALLFLLLPAGVLFADTISGGGSLTHGNSGNHPEESEPEATDEEEPEEEEEDEAETGEPSEQAGIVAERIEAARLLEMAPGHLNLIDRLARICESTREQVMLDFPDASVKTIMQEIKKCRFAAMGKEMPGGDEETEEDLDVAGEISEGTGHSNGHGKANGHNKG